MDRYYVGHTSNLEKRLEEHNKGISVFTSKANDWTLKWSKSFSTRKEAKAEEMLIKKKNSKKYIEYLIELRRAN